MEQPVEYTLADGIGVLRVNRPASRNALNWAAQERFAEIVKSASEEPALHVLIITGAGERAFVSGGDLKQLSLHTDEADGERLNRTMSAALEQLSALPLPVIAAVNGDAFGGGCEIISACDLRLAAAHVRFGYAQIHNGLTTGWGGAGRLVRLLGQSTAMELLLTGRVFDAAEAKRIGLLHRLLPAGEAALPAARAWAAELIALPHDALAALKALVHYAGQHTPAETNAYEAQLFRQIWTSPNHVEALQAFVEKRRPRFNRP